MFRQMVNCVQMGQNYCQWRGNNMMWAYFIRIEESSNQRRFYAIYITKTIFDEWAVIREWGRIGSPGTVREEWFCDEPNAIQEANKIVARRIQREYNRVIL